MSFFYQFAFHGFVCSVQRDFYLKENEGREEGRKGKVLGECNAGGFVRDTKTG